MTYATVTITGTYEINDAPAVGRVIVTPDCNTVSDIEGNVVKYGSWEVALNTNGSFSLALPATNDPNILPQNFTYTLKGDFDKGSIPSVTFSLPSNLVSVDVTDLMPVVGSAGTIPNNLYLATTLLGAPYGVAPLDGDSRVPEVNLPSNTFATKNNPNITGDAIIERLGIGLGVSSVRNPLNVWFDLSSSEVDSDTRVGNVVASNLLGVFSGDYTVSATVTITATGGTARWTIGGQFTDIPYNATANTVETSLRSLSTVGAGVGIYPYIIVTGTPGSYVVTYTPRFLMDVSWNSRELFLDGTNLTGPNPSAVIDWTNLGGADTGWAFGAVDYIVTGVSNAGGNGIGRLIGRVMEADLRSSGTVGLLTGGWSETSHAGSSATGTVHREIGHRITVGRHKDGAVPNAGITNEIYGLYVTAVIPERTITDATTTNASSVVTSATGYFTAYDANKVVIGTNIPANTYILSVESSTSCTLSNPCTGSGVVTMTIKGPAQAATAYIAYFEPGVIKSDGQLLIQPTHSNVPAIKASARPGITNGHVLEILDGSGVVKAYFDALGFMALKNNITTYEGDASGRSITIGGTTVDSIARASITFNTDALLFRYAPNVLSMGYGDSFRFSTKSEGGGRPNAATVGKGAVIYDDTLSPPIPIISDGTVWRNFMGTAV